MRHGAQVLKRGVLLLERVSDRITFAQYLDLPCLDLDGLAASDGLDQIAGHADACPCCYPRDESLVEVGHVCHDLNVIDCRAIVKGDELDLLVTSFGPYPSFGEYFLPRIRLE